VWVCECVLCMCYVCVMYVDIYVHMKVYVSKDCDDKGFEEIQC